jgi:hypothetical protein
MTETQVELNRQETRKEWAAPELRKVDIEQITAHGGSKKFDGKGSQS